MSLADEVRKAVEPYMDERQHGLLVDHAIADDILNLPAVAASRLFAIEDALDSDAWYTPAWVFDGLGLEFDLDVSAPAEPLPWIPAKQSYTVADDGLIQPWFGTVWCNPPYSAPTAWCRKWAEHEGGGCLLIRADLSTSGPFRAWSAATSAYVPAKRLQFVNGHGGETGAVNFSTILLGRGDHVDLAMKRLADTYGGTAHLFNPHPHQGEPPNA